MISTNAIPDTKTTLLPHLISPAGLAKGKNVLPLAFGITSLSQTWLAQNMGATDSMSRGAGGAHLWLSSSASKRWTEVLYLSYSAFWILWALCIFVPLKLYERCDEKGYMAVCLAAAAPCVGLPLVLQPAWELKTPWHRRYWVKANLWIAIFSFIGNYFWTHYFYELLGAEYTFPTWRLNNVPIPLYFMTHAYFLFYHSLSNVCIRRARHFSQKWGAEAMCLTAAAVVFLLAYATAYAETLTISHFPHYRFKDKTRMYTVGSLFYAIYFFVSFPVFFEMDEKPQRIWSLRAAATDSLASGMLVTILLDLWRLFFGGIVKASLSSSLPWSSNSS